MNAPDALPRGIVTPLVTFLSPDGAPDPVGMAALVEYQLHAGIHGLLAVGSTGELGLLTPAQRTRTIEIVAQSTAGRAPVWGGVVGLGTEEAVIAAQDAARAGADALLALPPMFFDSSDDELVGHFTTVAEAVDVPVVVYDVPPRTPRKIPASVVERLARSGAVRGVKDSSGDLTAGRLTIEAVADVPGFRNYIGSEITIDAAFVLGFDGIVPGFANVLPRPAVELFDAAASGRVAEDAQRRYLELFEVLRVPLAGAGGPAAAINALKTGTAHVLGIEDAPVAEPFTQADPAFRDRVAEIVDAANR